MILEVAILNVKSGQEQAFETAFDAAQNIIAGMKGYRGHRLARCLEKPCRYILL